MNTPHTLSNVFAPSRRVKPPVFNITRLVMFSVSLAALAAVLSIMGCPHHARGAEHAAKAQQMSGTARVDLNHATSEELMTLPNIGAKRAAAIIAFRRKHPFIRTSDIMRVRGIGRKRYAALQPMITVTASSSGSGHGAAQPPNPTAAARKLPQQRPTP